MTDDTKPANLTLARALHLARAGFVVFPCRPNSKRPGTNNGLLDATTDEAQIRTWFDNDRQYNLAVACGPQPNGINLLAIDVDPLKGGDETWATLTSNGHELPPCPIHTTRSGGWHLFYDAPAGFHSTAGRLGVGIDTRGVGGYVVVPPSRVVDPDSGEIGTYTTQRDQALSVATVPLLPTWLIEMLTDDDGYARHPSRQPTNFINLGDSVADLARQGWDWTAELDRDGWVRVRVRGGDEYWTRPGKNPREGHSAVLHGDDGPLVVFTTERPPGGRATAHGEGSSFSPWDYIVAYRAGGDTRRAAAIVRGKPSPQPGHSAVERAVTTTDASDDTAGDEVSPWQMPMVPAEYWSASARNAHVLAAARAALVSPDALDLVVFALQSCLIPPSYLLPRIVGAGQPLNFLACLVAPTGMFKTATLDAARDLMGPLPPWVTAIGMGSGEGIGATFLKEETEVNEKTGKAQKTGRLVRNEIAAAFFEADEGSGLTEQAGRAGATIIANLCKAWSGSTLGEANADPAKRRHVLDRDYRIAALVNIQPSNFAGLFSIANTGTGLTGRFMFSGTTDASISDEDTDWPGPLDHPHFPDMPLEVGIDPRIISGIRADIRRRHREGGLDTTVDATAQNAAVVARMAGIAVLVDGRREITVGDWEVAQMRARTSALCLQKLATWDFQRARDLRHTAAVARAETEIVVQSLKERQAITSMAENIARKSAGGIGRNKLARIVAKSSLRYRFDDALERAVTNGWVRVDGDRVIKL